MEQGLDHWADVVIIVVYFVGVLAVGLWTLFRPNRGNVKSYFLAGRDMTWWPVGASLYASNIGSEHFIGLAGTGAASGIAVVLYEWMSLPLVLTLCWLFLPIYISAGVYTLPEYLQKRFGGERLRVYLSCLALLLYIVTKIAVCIYAGGLFIQLALGWDMYAAIGVLLGITAIYTVLGGLAAVIYTDAVQTVIMTAGAIALTVISFDKIGGYSNFQSLYMKSAPSPRPTLSPNDTSSRNDSFYGNDTLPLCDGLPRSDSFHVFRHPVYSDNPWPGLLLQSTIGCLWYWCADQVIVQRALAAKNVSHAKGGALLAGYLKLTPLFLLIFPGMISRALYPDEVACTDPEECMKYCGIDIGCSNIAYPKLVMTLLPVGLRGLLLATMMSAIMSSLTSIFNSSSTLFTIDIYRKIRPLASQRELLIVGRMCIVVLCGVSILWIPLLKSSAGGQLFVYIQSIQGYLGTPIGAVFVIAIFWKRMTEHGAFWGLLAGHTCGITRMVLDFVYPAPACGQPDTRPSVVADVHYTYFSQINMVITSLVIVIISLITKQRDDELLAGVTWSTRTRVKASSEMPPDDVTKTTNSTEQYVNSVSSITQQLDSNGDNGTETKNATDDVVVKSKVWRRWCDVVCGLPPSDATELPSATETDAERLVLLEEKPFWKSFLNANAVVSLIVVAFLCGFFH